MRRMTIALLAAVAILAPAAVTPAAAQGFSFYIGTPPPAPIYEPVPVPRTGFVWAPGHWRWAYGQQVWVPGHWVPARPYRHWVGDRWVEGPYGWRY